MKLTEEFGAGTYRIRAYEPGRVTINQEVLEHSVIVSADTLIRDWPPETVSELNADHMAMIADLEPEVVLLGTGDRQQFPDRYLLRDLIARGIGIEVMDSAAACRTFNVLLAEERRVVAGLLLR